MQHMWEIYFIHLGKRYIKEYTMIIAKQFQRKIRISNIIKIKTIKVLSNENSIGKNIIS